MPRRLREMRLSRARARAEQRAEDKPAVPDEAEKFKKQARDLDALRKAVEDAASVSAGLWLSYLFVLFYIGIAAGAVTHKDLLLENPVKLPFLSDVPLPLVAFFFLAPILFIVSHVYTLVHFVMLSAKVGVFDKELRAQLGDAPETREGLRRQLPSNIFVQFLAGPGDIRKGGLGWLLKAIAWITLVIGPVLLLLLIQVQFLPYHLEWVTWAQRFAVLVDVILLWAFWPAVLNGRSKIRLPRFWRHPVVTLASFIPVGLAFTAATFPGEWMDEYIGNKQWIPPNLVTERLGLIQKDEEGQPIWTSFHDLLFDGEVDYATGRQNSLFSNKLVLPRFDAIEAAKFNDPKKLASVKHTLNLSGRHLEGAIFNRADLRKVDLERAQLRGALFYVAQLQGASLNYAQLQGASLWKALLHGASLEEAQLQGASLEVAQLHGASLNFAHVQGASLRSAELYGASLDGAELQGASLEMAQLQGASLYSAQLQGANFRESSLAGTNMRDAAIWRATFDGASLAAIFEDGLKDEALSRDQFAALKRGIITKIPEGDVREDVLKSIEKLNPDLLDVEASQIQTLKKGRVDKAVYQKALAGELKMLVCFSDESGSYIVRELARSQLRGLGAGTVKLARITDAGPLVPGLIKSLLSSDCPVSATLTEQDKADLRRLAEMDYSEAHASERKQ